ncbi:MAG TPA: ATPase domain-containing protein, partial [Chloroflexota bacterium]|nr:ATPase domain-containing protein [Chloroflexota bacterium]
MSSSESPELLETGVPNLDLILDGGIPREDVLLVVGQAGTGKTTLSLQILFHAARAGETVLYVSTVSEPVTKLLRHIRSYSFYDEQLIGKRVFLLSAYPMIRQDLSAVTEALIKTVKEHQATVVVIDGMMSFHDLHPGGTEVRTFIYDLGATLATLGCTTIVTSSGIARREERESPEFTMADGVIVLDMDEIGGQMFRRIMIRKIRGLNPLLGKHSFRLDTNGITVYPRLESTFTPTDVELGLERTATGIPELDTLMSGGPWRGSITVLAGALGTGKTLECLEFIMEGARLGEKGLFIGFRETREQLIDKARFFNIDLEGAIRDGRVDVFHRAPVDLDLDRITWEIFREVDMFAPRRLVIDSVIEIEDLVLEGRRARGYMAALAGQLRQVGVTSLISKEIPQVVGAELDFSDTPLAVLAENLMLLRWVE